MHLHSEVNEPKYLGIGSHPTHIIKISGQRKTGSYLLNTYYVPSNILFKTIQSSELPNEIV